MVTNPKHIARPATPAAKPLTKEEQAAQVARFFSQKREALFQGILFNAVYSDPNVDLRVLVDRAIDAADYAIEKLYPLPKEGEAE